MGCACVTVLALMAGCLGLFDGKSRIFYFKSVKLPFITSFCRLASVHPRAVARPP